jgi:putative ABC transport system ATP-binding protein
MPAHTFISDGLMDPLISQNDHRKNTKPIIEIYKANKVFHTPAGDFHALKEITTNIYPGEFLSVVGKSGSGKSTLVNMLTGIDHPTSGNICIDDIPIHQMSESDMSIWRGKNLGIIFQFFQLLPMLSLIENVMIPMDFVNRYPTSERPKRAAALIERLGLSDVADELPGAVSGGQQQTAAIARALANDPPILIADEPTGNLDSQTADKIFKIFRELSREGKTIVMVTHDPLIAQLTDRILMLYDGELIPPKTPLFEQLIQLTISLNKTGQQSQSET